MVLDDLTKLYNRRELFTRLRQEIARSKRSHIPFSILLIDIDHFKTVNDNYGHLRGDRILTEVADIIRGNCREMDIPCRYGGDEFVVLLPETDRWAAEKAAERLLICFCDRTFLGNEEQPDLHLTVSIGTSTYESNVETPEILIERADRALYTAKKGGRNQICKDIDTREVSKEPRLNFAGFVDRDEELDVLKRMFDAMTKKQGQSIIVNGEAGIGKTRLVLELEKYAKMHKALFLTAKPFEFGVTPPYHIFFQVIKTYAQSSDKVRAQGFAALPSVYKAELVKFIPELRVAISPSQQASRISPEYEKMRLFDAVYQALEIMTHESAVFIFFDDMQWSREADLELLGYLMRNIAHLRVCICCAYRTEEIDERHPLQQFLRAMSRERRFESILLRGLSEKDTLLLINTIIGFAVPVHISKMIYDETNGNPFYIEEIIKSLVNDRSLFWNGSRWAFHDIDKITLPTSVGDLLQRRLNDVDQEQKDILAVASAIGNQFSLGLLQYVTESNEGYLLDVLDACMKRGLIGLEGEDVYSFSSILLQRTLYEDMSAIKKRRLHLKIAQTIERLNFDNIEQVYENLAHHYLMAEYWETAFEYNFKAAEKLKKLYANQDAILRYRTCVQLIKKNHIARPDIEPKISGGLADIYYLIGDYAEAIKQYRKVLEHKDLSPVQRSDVLRNMARVYQRLADFDNSLDCLAKGRELLSEEENALKIARIDSDSIWIHNKRGEYEKGIGIGEKALKIFEKEESSEDIGTLYANLGTIYFEHGEWDKAEEYYRRSLECRERTNDEHSIASSYNNLGNVYQRKADYQKAILHHQRALQLREKIGDRYGIASSYNNLALVYDYLGNWEKCLDYHHRSLDISVQITSPHSVALSYSNIGFILIKKGDFNEALQYSLKALDATERIGDLMHVTSVQNNLAHIYLKTDERERAKEFLDKARATSEKCHYSSLLAENCKLYAEYYLVENDLENVRKYMNDAQKLAEQIGDPDALAETYIIMGKYYVRKGDYPEAIKAYEKCEEISRPIHNAYVCGICLFHTGEAYKESGDLEKAQQYFTEAKKILQDLGVQDYLQKLDKIL
jgi:diguanylate cyclase (GGDEF)-like protein